MCISCGCGDPKDDMGNADTITLEDLEKAAKASDISVDEVAKNIGSYSTEKPKRPPHPVPDSLRPVGVGQNQGSA